MLIRSSIYRMFKKILGKVYVHAHQEGFKVFFSLYFILQPIHLILTYLIPLTIEFSDKSAS